MRMAVVLIHNSRNAEKIADPSAQVIPETSMSGKFKT